MPMILRRILLALMLVLPAGLVIAQDLREARALDQARAQLAAIETELPAAATEQLPLARWLAEIGQIRSQALDCVTHQERDIALLERDLASLGEPLAGDPAELTRQRRTLQADTEARNKSLAGCRLLALRSEQLSTRVSDLQKHLLAERLLSSGPNFYTLLKDNLLQPQDWLESTWTFIVEHSGLQYLKGWRLVGLLLSLLAGVLLTWWLRRISWREDFVTQHSDTLVERFYSALYTTFRHYAPHLLVSLSAAVYFYLTLHRTAPVPFVNIIAYGLPVLFFLLVVIYVFLAPLPPARQCFVISARYTRKLAARLKVLLLLLFIGYLMFSTLLAQSLPADALLLARGVFAAFLILNLMWIIWLFGKLFQRADNLALRSSFMLVLFAVLIAEWLGYRNLSVVVLLGVLGTLLALGGLWLVLQMMHDLFDNLAHGRRPWQKRVRNIFGITAQEKIPGLSWVEILTNLAVWALFFYLLLHIWGLSDTVWQKLRVYLYEGFLVGSLKVVPVRLILAVFIFVTLLMVTGWFKNQIEKRWLNQTRIERGAREAIVTISGYTGIAVAILVALGITGVEFTNLAIIAGALSVGIGFGLQNIVNNFVSGLILLFERPVKTGDWIVVGNTEGYVKRIRIRSTQIQTFDRADVIVPNSELISSQVINWMLYDERGRVRVPVGVAYGSNTQLVKEVLLQVADQHPDVIKDDEENAPRVLFLQFGDSSLSFELRVHIRNINKRLSVLSDMNFAIDAAFREKGIEIPFPQRDLHIKNWPPQRPADAGTSDE